MGQVTSSVKESDGFYKITLKERPNAPKGTPKPPSEPIPYTSRYKIPGGIVQKIKEINFKNDIQLAEGKKLTQLEQIQILTAIIPGENVPQLSDNYDSGKPSYLYLNFSKLPQTEIDSWMKKLYAMEKGIEWSGNTQEINMPKDYAFLIDPCPEGFTCAIDGGNLDGAFSKIGSATGIGFYSSLLACTISSLCTLIAILAVNVSSSGFNALTVILILLILSSCSTCITNVFKIYTLKQELQK